MLRQVTEFGSIDL